MGSGHSGDIPSNIVGRPDFPNDAVVGMEDRRDVYLSLAHRYCRDHRYHREEPDAEIRNRDPHDETDWAEERVRLRSG